MNNFEHTINTWNQLSEKYQDGFMDLTLYNESYNVFCELLKKKNPSILELGCGPGNITKYLLSQRPDFKINATDAAPNMVALAKKNNPTAACELLDVRNISGLNNKYNALVCGFCLPYLSESECKKLIKDCVQILHDDGLIYLSFIEGDYSQSKLESSSDGQHSMFVYYYSEVFISKIFDNNNFNVIKVFRIPYTKANGKESIHLIFIAQKKH